MTEFVIVDIESFLTGLRMLMQASFFEGASSLVEPFIKDQWGEDKVAKVTVDFSELLMMQNWEKSEAKQKFGELLKGIKEEFDGKG